MHTIKIGARFLGGGAPTFIVAEAGSNHNRSFGQAKALIDVAAIAGADAVKFQLFRAAKLYPSNAGSSDYLQTSKPIYQIIADMETPYEWLGELAQHCHEQGMEFLCSAFDEESVDRVDPFVAAHKVASYEMTHTPLLRHIAKKNKPVIISTGTAQMSEVAEAIALLRQEGNEQLVVLQCTASYPAPLEALNLRAMKTMEAELGVLVGLSDHSRDPVVGPLGAVALGAALVEKHFTLSNALPGPDHRFALEPSELQAMVTKIREIEKALGTGCKEVLPVEIELRNFARRSIFAVRDIAVGERFTAENIAVLRCGQLKAGVEPKIYSILLSRRARRSVRSQTAITSEDYE
jgi:N-acetylneuraminate synthase